MPQYKKRTVPHKWNGSTQHYEEKLFKPLIVEHGVFDFV